MFCPAARKAPVARFEDDPWSPIGEVAIVARGPRSYQAALCLMNETSLAICEGGHDFSHVSPLLFTIVGDEDAPEILSSTPANGAIDVPSTLTEIRVVMSRPLAADEHTTVEISNVHRGLPEFLPGPRTTAVPGELVISVAGLEPKTLYRLTVPASRDVGDPGTRRARRRHTRSRGVSRGRTFRWPGHRRRAEVPGVQGALVQAGETLYGSDYSIVDVSNPVAPQKRNASGIKFGVTSIIHHAGAILMSLVRNDADGFPPAVHFHSLSNLSNLGNVEVMLPYGEDIVKIATHEDHVLVLHSTGLVVLGTD